jgi:hypothetical protein
MHFALKQILTHVHLVDVGNITCWKNVCIVNF